MNDSDSRNGCRAAATGPAGQGAYSTIFPTLNIVTACSRPENLLRIKLSVKQILNYAEVRWIIVYNEDLRPQGFREAWIHETVYGHRNAGGYVQKNLGLQLCKPGWVYYLDDDNLILPEFGETLLYVLQKSDFARAILFDQVNAKGKRRIRADTDAIRVGRVDQGSVVLHTDAIGHIQHGIGALAADGRFIEEVCRGRKDVVAENEPATGYNMMKCASGKTYVTVASDLWRALHFIDSVRRIGYEPVVLGLRSAFQSFRAKTIYMRDFLADARGPVVYADAFDSLVLHDDFEIPSGVTFAAEKNNYPDPQLVYPECATPYRYLNAGGCCGDAEDLRSLFEKVRHDKGDEQLNWARYHVANPGAIALDHDARIFMCLNRAPDDLNDEGLNIHTGARPAIIHNNGSHGQQVPARIARLIESEPAPAHLVAAQVEGRMA